LSFLCLFVGTKKNHSYADRDGSQSRNRPPQSRACGYAARFQSKASGDSTGRCIAACGLAAESQFNAACCRASR
jgi:hypothetical protein